jgi:hypothetical protein
MDAPQESSSFNFQRIVIMIAIVMLIMAMCVIGYALYYQHTDITWPPADPPKCPDYWTVDAKGNCTEPKMPVNCEYNGIPAGTQGMPACPNKQ